MWGAARRQQQSDRFRISFERRKQSRLELDETTPPSRTSTRGLNGGCCCNFLLLLFWHHFWEGRLNLDCVQLFNFVFFLVAEGGGKRRHVLRQSPTGRDTRISRRRLRKYVLRENKPFVAVRGEILLAKHTEKGRTDKKTQTGKQA